MVILMLDDQPPLIQAIFYGEFDDVKNLLESKPDVNLQDSEKRSPLHAAAYKGDKDLAQLLITQGARVNMRDGKWYTPLHRACGVGSDITVELLLKNNADICARDRQWQTPLHIAAANNALECVSHLLNHIPNVNVTDRAGRTALHHAALNGHNDVVELLISKGCIVNACDKKDSRPIHCAAHLGHVNTLEQLLQCGADVNVKDRNQYTPLHAAAASGMLYACRLLLSSGADVNVQNSYGNTPLHIACLNGHLNICNELIANKADLEMCNYKGQTALHIAAASTHGMPCLQCLMENNVNINRHSLDGRTALHMSAIHGRFTRSKALIDNGAIIDAMDKNGATALHVAAQYGHDILSATLLGHGADPRKGGYQGRTPLHISCLSGFVECCRKFAQVTTDINVPDDDGRTPIHCAAYKGSVECLDLLASHGGDFKVADNYGGTALHYAASKGHYNCVFTLVGIGTPVNVLDNDGCTALHLAAAFDKLGRCVQYLLQHKADPSTRDSRGFTPIHYAVANSNGNAAKYLFEAFSGNFALYEPDIKYALTTPLHLAAKRGDVKILQQVIQFFPDTNIRDANGATPLLLAAREGHTHSVQMLLRYGSRVAICEERNQMSPVHYSARNGHMHCLALLVDNAEDKRIIDKPDRLNRTALMLAVSGSHSDCVVTLLESNADPNIVDADRHSSLFRAVVTGQKYVVQLLIAKGALVSPPDCNGKTVLHLAAACGQFTCLQTVFNHFKQPEDASVCDNLKFNALHWACYNGNALCLEYLLEKDVFKELGGNLFSPVHCAIFAGSERCLELLCARFTAQIVQLVDARGRTPLHIAALHGHTECARFLLEKGAEINFKDDMGRTALIAAAQNGQSQIIDLLVSHKADVKLRDSNGNTALHLACLKRHNHTALLILEYINDVDTINMTNNDLKTSLHLAARNGLVDVTRDLIKKGSSVVAVDSNGLTPALSCAPNHSVAQCLAIILANYPVQFPTSNEVSKGMDLLKSLFASPKPTSKCHIQQTEISLLRDPREIFQDIFHKIEPPHLNKGPNSMQRQSNKTGGNNRTLRQYNGPAMRRNGAKIKNKLSNSGLLLIENYDKNELIEHNVPITGLGLHRSLSEIALVDAKTDDFERKKSVEKLITGYKTVAKKMAELTKMYDVSYEDINRVYMNHCNQKITENRSLINNRHVEKYEDVFTKVLGARATIADNVAQQEIGATTHQSCGDVRPIKAQETSSASVVKHCCESVCAKCVNTNMFDQDAHGACVVDHFDCHDCLDTPTHVDASTSDVSLNNAPETDEDADNAPHINTIFNGSITDVRLGAISKTHSLLTQDIADEPNLINFEYNLSQQSVDDFKENRSDIRIVELDVHEGAKNELAGEFDAFLSPQNDENCFNKIHYDNDEGALKLEFEPEDSDIYAESGNTLVTVEPYPDEINESLDLIENVNEIKCTGVRQNDIECTDAQNALYLVNETCAIVCDIDKENVGALKKDLKTLYNDKQATDSLQNDLNIDNQNADLNALNNHKQTAAILIDEENILIIDKHKADTFNTDLKALNNTKKRADLYTLNNDKQNADLKTLNKNKQSDDFKTLNNNKQSADLNTLNNDKQNADLKTLNNNKQSVDLKTLNNNKQSADLNTLNNDKQNADLKTLNNNKQSADLNTLYKQNADLKTLNNNKQSADLNTLNNDKQNADLKTLNNNKQSADLKTLNNNKQSADLNTLNNDKQNADLKTLNNTQNAYALNVNVEQLNEDKQNADALNNDLEAFNTHKLESVRIGGTECIENEIEGENARSEPEIDDEKYPLTLDEVRLLVNTNDERFTNALAAEGATGEELIKLSDKELQKFMKNIKRPHMRNAHKFTQQNFCNSDNLENNKIDDFNSQNSSDNEYY